MIGRPVGRNQLQKSRRQGEKIQGLGHDGRGIYSMTVEYLHGPEAVRLSRKCSRQREHNYRSEAKLDRDVEEGRARIRASALVEELGYEGNSHETYQEKIIDAVARECKELGYTISCREAALRRVFDAASAITLSVQGTRKKWMIDSGCAMDLISKRELRDEEMALAERVRRIKFNTANGNTSSEMAITFDIETLAECALVRILDSSPAVLSMGMRCMRMGYSFHWPAGYDPVFIRPDNKHVRLQVIGDIPYLTEALSCARQGKGIEPYRALPAMPAPTTLPSRWNAKVGITSQEESSSEDESDNERAAPTIVSKAGGRWLIHERDVIMFVYKWRSGYPDPIAEAAKEPWVVEYLARCLPVCKVRASLRDGSKVMIWRDWMLPKGLSNPKHSVDFHPSVLDESEWKGKIIFKIPRESQRERLRDVVEKVREAVERETRPETTETPRTDQNRKRSGNVTTCAACLADVIGLCAIHERDLVNVSASEQGNSLGGVAAEAANGGIPENSTSSETREKSEVATPGEPVHPDEPLEDIPDRIPGDTDEEGEAERDGGIREREPAGPELADVPNEEMGRALAPLGDKRRLEAVDRKRRSDKSEAVSTSHLLAHFPKNIHCIACRQAKVTNVRFNRRKREFMSEAKAFGDRVTADTILLKGTRDRGVHGESNAIVFFDLATGWIDCIPVKSRHTDETVKAITHFQGPERRHQTALHRSGPGV